MSYLLKLGVLDGGFDLLDALLMDKLLAELLLDDVTAEILSLVVPPGLLLLVVLLPISKTVT